METVAKLLLEDYQSPGNNQSPQRNKMIKSCEKLEGWRGGGLPVNEHKEHFEIREIFYILIVILVK